MKKSARLGQNFLVNPGVADRIVSLVQPGDTPLLEIGPGKGMLTTRLAEKFSNRRLLAVEIDPLLAAHLRQTLGEKVTVVEEDFLTFSVEANFFEQKVTLISNIPYHISKKIIRKICHNPFIWHQGVLMTQKEFARKLLSESTPLSIIFLCLFSTGGSFNVSPGSFSPAPRVNSLVFTFAPQRHNVSAPELPGFRQFVYQGFFHPRKTLAANLGFSYNRNTVCSALESLDLHCSIRAEKTGAANFLRLFRILSRGRNSINI